MDCVLVLCRLQIGEGEWTERIGPAPWALLRNTLSFEREVLAPHVITISHEWNKYN